HESRTSTSVSHDLHHLPENLSTPTKICLYRLVQEGLNNAYRHGAGIDQRIDVSVQGSLLFLTISDGGPGMDVDDVSKINDADHLGLRGMRERVESLGGDFQITRSGKSGGVKLIATLPIDD
ncbi:MAG: ATP-binding protein, partial [Gammaproteobacteria bacterium]